MPARGQDGGEARRVVWISHRSGERCAGCGAELFKGAFIQIARETGIRCMACAGYADLAYLPSGDPALTRRAVALSAPSATVVRFSKTRKRNERQGTLVEEAALEAAREACEQDAAERARLAEGRRARDEAAEREYVARFARRILELFPACPGADAEGIARRACQKPSGRVGRTAAAKAFDERAVRLAVRAHIRHQHTRYDEPLLQGLDPAEARAEVSARLQEVYYTAGACRRRAEAQTGEQPAAAEPARREPPRREA